MLPWIAYSKDDYTHLLNDLESLCVLSLVRNPYSRLLSGYLDKMSYGKLLTQQQIKDKLALFNLREFPDSFAAFVQQVTEQSDQQANLHWQSQSYILCFDFIRYGLIGHFEQLDQFYQQLTERLLGSQQTEIVVSESKIAHKTSASSRLDEFYNAELAELVYKRYRQDFDNFGYDKDINQIFPDTTINPGISSGQYRALLEPIINLVYEAKHNKKRGVNCRKLENWANQQAEVLIINKSVLKQTGFAVASDKSSELLDSVPSFQPQQHDHQVSQMVTDWGSQDSRLTLDQLEQAWMVPVVGVDTQPEGKYASSIRIIGGIYAADGTPYRRSLLARGAIHLQEIDPDYQPVNDRGIRFVESGIYGGIIDQHYGHFLIETLARAWYLKDSQGDVYFDLMNPRKPRSFDALAQWQQELLVAMLGNENRVKFIDKKMRFGRLLVPAPGAVCLSYCTKIQAEALSEIGQRVFSSATRAINNSPKKVWLSRSSLNKGAIAGEVDFASALEKENFAIVYPEQLSLAEQIGIFQQADHIAGFTGSAFHTVLLAKNHGARLIQFSRTDKLHVNYPIFTDITDFASEFHNYFLRYGQLKNVNTANVVQDLSQIWQVLHARGLVKAQSYHDPHLEAKLQQLDQMQQKNTPSVPIINNLPVTMNHSARRINQLAKALNGRHYLEIGVNKGHTFFKIALANKTAVDPNFLFDVAAVDDKRAVFKQNTSDDFFQTLEQSTRYDIIFVDGLHTFEQTYRDLCNCLLHSHERTVLLIDDTRPIDVYSAIPEQRKAVQQRKLAGFQGGAWHGDVYKVIFALHDFHPGLNYRTIVGSGNPQTLVWQSRSERRKPLFNSFEQISRLDYFALQEHISILNCCSEDEAINLCINELAGK